MFVAPGAVRGGWPWTTVAGGPIAPLSLRALSAWALAFGVLAAHSVRENDVHRVRPALLAYPVLVVLYVIALARFGDVIEWDRPSTYVFLVYLASCAVVAVFGIAHWRRPPEERWIEVDPRNDEEFTE
jgi:peptidoglycan/LPS O-acetylase OafA/YrhL